VAAAAQRASSSTSEPRPEKLLIQKDADFPSMGVYGESDDISGGMGMQGVARSISFVTMGRADHLGRGQLLRAADVHHPDCGRRATTRPSTRRAHRGGGILQPNHPEFYGYTVVWCRCVGPGGPSCASPPTNRNGSSCASPAATAVVLSGLMRGVAETRLRPAVIDENR